MENEQNHDSELEVLSVSFIYDRNRENDWKEVYLSLFEEELFQMLEEGAKNI
ncbi:hypothetical protein QNK12_06445 [Neobacillus cucumis]|nr:hypothetical protein QNK12_06445 [Neobacillus cucumis]